MSDLSKKIALGAAAVGAGAVVLGAAVAVRNTLNSPLRSGSSNYGGGGAVSVEVPEPHVSIVFQQPKADDVFLSANVPVTLTFKDTRELFFTLTAPGGTNCNLGNYTAPNDGWMTSGITYTGNISLGNCGGAKYGAYKYKATTADWSPEVSNEITFNYARFEFGSSVYDRNGDPIVVLRYGSGIGRVDFSAYCNDNETDVLGDYEYVPEKNEDYVDEVLLPFKNKNISAGNCNVTATAKKANGDPINSIDVSGATIQTTVTYTGI